MRDFFNADCGVTHIVVTGLERMQFMPIVTVSEAFLISV